MKRKATKNKAGVTFHYCRTSLTGFVKDLSIGLSDEAAALPLDIYLGLHEQTPVGVSKRLRLGIQTENLTGETPAGVLEHIRRTVPLYDYIIDYNPDNFAFYSSIPGYDCARLLMGPYIFPASRPHAYTPTTVNPQTVTSPVQELSRFLRSYTTGTVFNAQAMQAPFQAGRHYETSPGAAETDTILDNITRDFARFTFSQALIWMAAGGPFGKALTYMGPCDRHNYGDLLMPVILQEFQRKHFPSASRLPIRVTALRESDWTRQGGMRTEPAYTEQGLTGREGAVIVCGGEIIGAKRSALGNVPNNAAQVPEFPYTPEPEMAWRLLMTSVSGSNKPDALKNVAGMTYCNFRDGRLAAFAAESPLTRAVCPDSATMLSTLWPPEALRSLCRPEVLDALPDRFIVYQGCDAQITTPAQEIGESLNDICNKAGTRCILLPLSRTDGQDDNVHLSAIQATQPDFILAQDLHLAEMAWIIARADLFMGTAVHGVATAISYGRPFVALQDNVRQLRSYVSTWAPRPFSKFHALSDAAQWLALSPADRENALSILQDHVIHLKNRAEARTYTLFREALFDL